MTTKKSTQESQSRSAKRSRFSEEEKRAGGALPLVLVAGVVVTLALIGGMIFALPRPAPSSAEAAGSAPAPKLETYRTGSAGLLVKAATSGHEPYPLVEADNGAVRLPLAVFDDYEAHHYTYMYQGQSIEFFVLKSNDGVVRAAFNACDVCFAAKKGYTQDGDHVVCNNCGRRFPAEQINVVQGGCNPSPLERSVEGDTLVIQEKDIVAGLGYF